MLHKHLFSYASIKAQSLVNIFTLNISAETNAETGSRVLTERMRIISAITTAFICSFIFGCGNNHAQNDDRKQLGSDNVLRRAIGGEPGSLDPGQAIDSYSYEVLRDLYEGLTTEAQDGTVQPGVASSWTISPSGKQYRFSLRDNAKWSDGSRVHAQDFVNAWRRVVDPARASRAADILRPVQGANAIIAGRLPSSSLGVSAPQINLLIVNLEEPTPYFPELLTHSATFPIHSELAATSHVRTTFVSNGAYKLLNWTPGNKIQVEKNNFYWDRKNVSIRQVEYYPISDENSELSQYRANQLDLTQSVPASAVVLMRRERPDELFIAPYLGTAFYSINLLSGNGTSKLNVRKALAMAIDRKLILSKVLPFGLLPAYGFVPSGTWNYTPQTWLWKDLSDGLRITEAQKLYREAGYSAQNPLRLRVLLNSNTSIKQVALAIASNWQENLGVKTELVEEEYKVFLQSINDSSRSDLARIGWAADYNDATNFLDIFRSSSPNNHAHYLNPNFDMLLDKASNAANPSARRNLLEEAEKTMLSDYPIIPIYFYCSRRLVKPYVKGVTPNPMNTLYSKNLTINLR